MAEPSTPRFPGRAPIEAYGNAGFRFAGMSHRGSILCLASAIVAWDAPDPFDAAAALTPAHLAPVFAEKGAIEFLIIGTGRKQIFPTREMRQAFRDAGIGLDVMDTGAACRTYNVLLAEGRPLGAALVAVA
ncbi:MAG: Mth938-like domain-containing protein [Hyphomicrobiaceae bacterium]